ncbi:DNA-directed RNA polymerase I subunit RPA43 [Leucoraja erinacea]|uniref:DNA-directed RNA polymerase I subunit RPA43 n=1 Tax=Leucoraja erinaceus TaxID=7782 RepID=UPI002453BA4E|nr:DNA-directed RNA polymerase I subunit RPA43 [Leucoraja erinacea]
MPPTPAGPGSGPSRPPPPGPRSGPRLHPAPAPSPRRPGPLLHPGPAHSSTPAPRPGQSPPGPGPPAPRSPSLPPRPRPPAPPLSFTQARALIQSPFSCLVLDTCRRHLALCPLYLSRKRSGIERQLKTELLRFSETSHQCCSFVPEDAFDGLAKTGETSVGLQGVPVAYDKIRLIGELGDIYDDQGYIHLNIEADFVIFRPKIGQKLLGTVNKVAPSHLGCLVHGCFNASIPKPHHANGIWPDFAVKVGDSLEFEVQQLDADAAGVLCIRGRLDKSVQGPYGADFEELLEKDSIEQDGDAAGKKKRKKKKQKDEKCKEVIEEAVSCTSSDKSVSKHEMGDLQKNLERKSKKRKQRTEEPNTDNEFHENNTADYPNNSKPSKRKKKMIRDESGTTDCAQEPKHKRRKKD